MVATYRAELAKNVREHGRNAGPDVEKYLRSCGLGPGYYWCAAYITWCHRQAGLPVPRASGAARNWFAGAPLYYQRGSRGSRGSLDGARPGDVMGLYYPNLGRIGHIGFIDEVRDNVVITVEGNTGPDGGRDGDGVYRKRRMKRGIYAAANWVKD